MKKYLLIIFAILMSFNVVKAQNGNGQRAEKIQALKIAFITQKLQLTSEEAQKFWPVYNEYQNEVKGLRGQNKNEDVIENEEQLLNIRKKYRPEFEKVLGPDKTNKLFKVEGEFRTVLLKQIKNQRAKRGN